MKRKANERGELDEESEKMERVRDKKEVQEEDNKINENMGIDNQ